MRASLPAAPDLHLIADPVPPPHAPAAALIAAPATVHPALALLYALRERERAAGGGLPIDELIGEAGAIEAALEAASVDRTAHNRAIAVLKGAAALPSRRVPEGF